MSEFIRPRHRLVMAALRMLDAKFLAGAACYFGGGTRIALELNEYRESADIDFLCASHEGYRALRSTVNSASLGNIVKKPVALARDVIADRYGIRTFLDINGEKLKFEIVLEGRIALSGGKVDHLPVLVPVLDADSCFAEKFLANSDRWGDASVMGRDMIDLAYMAAGPSGWGSEPLGRGLAIATQAYGKVVARDARRAATRLLEDAAWRRRCVESLVITDTRTLLSGLRVVVKNV